MPAALISLCQKSGVIESAFTSAPSALPSPASICSLKLLIFHQTSPPATPARKHNRDDDTENNAETTTHGAR